MPTRNSCNTPGRLLLVCGMAVLAGCDGLSDVGQQDSEGAVPIARATVINQPSSVDSSGKITTRVRSGSEVVLTGRDSDGVVAPVLTFQWRERQGRVRLISRNSSTVSFKAPAAPATLNFTLTVTDAKGRSAQKEVDVIVDPVPDPDRFLAYTATPLAFAVEALTDAPASAFAQDAPFDIVMTRSVSYTDLRGRSRTVELAPRSFSGALSRSRGSTAQCGDTKNPRFVVDVPMLNLNELAEWVFEDLGNPSAMPDLSRVDRTAAADSAKLTVGFRIQPANDASRAALGVRQLRLCVTDAQRVPLRAAQVVGAGGAQPSDGALLADFTVDAGALAGTATLAGVDTNASTEAYYQTIDSPDLYAQKSTFLGWLKANGFVSQSQSSIAWRDVASGSTAQAIYVNNFDLGLGRDMYARRSCRNPATPTPGQCDVASVVVNYGSLEAAALKTDPIVAVAMEYTPLPGGDPDRRVVKFYTYAPDEQSGDFMRVNSVDLDGRGQKFMPGVCTVCHGGTPRGASGTAYGDGGDLNAAFLPWDVESLLFADSPSAGWSSEAYNSATSALHAQYTKGAQQAQVRELNRLAYLTYVDDPARPGRYQLLRDLLHTWYGDALDAATFREGQVPTQWSANEQERALYRSVYAQYCRMCHAAQVPNSSAGQTPAYEPYASCGTNQAYAGSGGQLAVGCYDQFVNLAQLDTVIKRGRMPNARMTMDRFWLNGGGTTAARSLAQHLGAIGKLQITDSTKPELNLMPQPTAVIDVVEVTPPGSDAEYVCALAAECASGIARGSVVRLLGSDSVLATAFNWNVARGATAVALVGASGSEPTFIADAPGNYAISLAVNGGPALNKSVSVPDWEPVAYADGVAPNLLTAAPNGSTVQIDVLANDRVRIKGTTAEAPLASGDGGYRVTLAGPATAGSVCAPQSVNGAGFTVSVSCGSNALTFSATTAGTKTFTYWLNDVDGDSSSATVSVVVANELTASPVCVPVSSLQTGVSFQSALTNRVSGGTPPYSFTFSTAGLRGSINSSAFTYSAPSLITDTTTAPKIFTGFDNGTYSVSDSGIDAANQTATGVLLRFGVSAQAPWSTVRNFWSSTGCTSCHTAGENPSFGYLDLTTGDGYDELLFGFRSGDATVRPPRVSLANPVTSKILQQVCPTPVPGQVDPCPGVTRNAGHTTKLSTANATTLFRWIREGGLETPNASSCP